MTTANQRTRNRIFGTPPEPLFNHCEIGVDADLLQECVQILILRNEHSLKETCPEQACFTKLNSVEFIFLTCEKLRMPSETKYLAIELFHRFILKHVQDLYSHVQNSGSKCKKKDWLAIIDRIRNQVMLRVVSCCQIASKLTSHYRVISTNRARRFLGDAGHRFTCDSILNSELRILKTLNFDVTKPSVLVYVESVLEQLGNTDLSIDVKVLHEVVLMVLDFVFMKYNTVYMKLYGVIKSQLSPTDKIYRNFLQTFSGNKMLLAVSVIASASFLIDQSSTDKISDNLCQLAEVKYELVVELATVLIQMITEEGEKITSFI